MIDFGCGKGTDTSFFAKRVKKVLGLDVSYLVVDYVNKNMPKVKFKQFNGLNKIEAIKIHKEYNDSNIFVNGVFHQLDILDAKKQLKIIIGQKGCILLNEMSEDFESVLKFNDFKFKELPFDLKLISLSKNMPKAFKEAIILENFSLEEYTIISKNITLKTTVKNSKGNFFKIPFVQYIITPKKKLNGF